MEQSPFQERASMLRWKVYQLVQKADVGIEVLNLLLYGGKPLDYEHELWDYKLDLPTLPIGRDPHEKERKSYREMMAGIVKDAVSFYNTFGGYLIAGIRDNPREIVGFGNRFDCEDLRRKIQSATGHQIDFSYSIKGIQLESAEVKIGILHIPKRPDSIAPAQFKKDAPATDTGFKAYKAKDIYFRQADECKQALESDDLAFLFGKGRRTLGGAVDYEPTPVISHNLGPRDPGFISFIGREEYLRLLWIWLCDKYNPCLLLTGIGGVGKTTIARAFADQIVISDPLGIERLIWLSAKQRFYTASLDSYRSTSRVDYTDISSLLKAILLELTYTEGEFEEEWAYDELVEKVIEALCEFPSFLVIDDIDSLAPEQQNEVFHTVIQITSRTASGAAPSRALLTARLELGAAPGQFLKVSGLKHGEFYDYVKMTAKELGVEWTFPSHHKVMAKFHRVADGSPTFASSILRLVRLGFDLPKALDRWEGNSGDEARRFAFQRELAVLKPSAVRTLYAACLLRETSLIELKQITEHNDTVLEDNIGELRNYHLLAHEGDYTVGGARLIVPSSITLMTNLIREQVKDPRKIEKSCGTVQKVVSVQEETVSTTIRRAIGLLKEGAAKAALDSLLVADNKYPDNPNLKCVLGQAYLEVKPPKAERAEQSLRQAYEMGCSRPEMLGLWVTAKELREDWKGVIALTRLENLSAPQSEKIFFRVGAYGKLAEIADSSGSPSTCLEYHRKIITAITRAFQRKQTRGRINEFNERLRSSFQRYIALTDQMASSPYRHIEVWDACYRAFSANIFQSSYVRRGVERLSSWWQAVERQQKYDTRKAKMLELQVRRLDDILNFLQSPNLSFPELIEFVKFHKQALKVRLRTYRARANN